MAAITLIAHHKDFCFMNPMVPIAEKDGLLKSDEEKHKVLLVKYYLEHYDQISPEQCDYIKQLYTEMKEILSVLRAEYFKERTKEEKRNYQKWLRTVESNLYDLKEIKSTIADSMLRGGMQVDDFYLMESENEVESESDSEENDEEEHLGLQQNDVVRSR